MVSSLAEAVPWMQSRADGLDRDGGFPQQEIGCLRRLGVLAPLLPVRREGSADDLATTLCLVGQGNLSVGRVFEAHVNALHLIGRYGSPSQWDAAMTSVAADGLFALWVTDPAEGGLRMQRDGDRVRLMGAKQFCSGAGHATGAIVTATDENRQIRMLALPLGVGETVTPLPQPLQGMRAAVTGAVDFTGCVVPASCLLGEPEDYLREPDFSAGAWRGSAVALGGLIALIDATVGQLQATGRLASPHAQARLGTAMIARETGRFWVHAAARVAEDLETDSQYRVATVGLGRIAVETACLDAMRLIQRTLGLSAFRQGNPVERICRDLATYLRQPAPDEVLTEAACWFAAHPAAALPT